MIIFFDAPSCDPKNIVPDPWITLSNVQLARLQHGRHYEMALQILRVLDSKGDPPRGVLQTTPAHGLKKNRGTAQTQTRPDSSMSRFQTHSVGERLDTRRCIPKSHPAEAGAGGLR